MAAVEQVQPRAGDARVQLLGQRDWRNVVALTVRVITMRGVPLTGTIVQPRYRLRTALGRGYPPRSKTTVPAKPWRYISRRDRDCRRRWR